jgi:hypothetical protein
MDTFVIVLRQCDCILAIFLDIARHGYVDYQIPVIPIECNTAI